jgi:hypothetical protein
MLFNGGDIVKLKDEVDEDYLIVLTKDSIEKQDLLKGHDYVVKKVNSDFIRYVYEDNVYKS